MSYVHGDHYFQFQLSELASQFRTFSFNVAINLLIGGLYFSRVTRGTVLGDNLFSNFQNSLFKFKFSILNFVIGIFLDKLYFADVTWVMFHDYIFIQFPIFKINYLNSNFQFFMLLLTIYFMDCILWVIHV